MNMLIKSLSFSTIFLLTAFISFGQKKNSLTSTVNEIAKCNIYEISGTIGFAGLASKQNQRLEQIVSLASEDQLLYLAKDHKNAIVRLYALLALKEKRIIISDSIKEQFQNDTTIVVTLNGCLAEEKSVQMLAMQILKVPASVSD